MTASSNNHGKRPKLEPEQGKKSRDARRMSRFPCNRAVYLTPRNGYIDCVVKHSCNHIRYKDITIPEKWRKYIIDNHKCGPTMVSIPCFVQFVITE